MDNPTAGIPLIIYESLKEIKEICDPEMFPSLFESLSNSINNLQQMIENKDFKHYRVESKPFYDAFTLIVESVRSLPPNQTLSPSDIKLFDSFQRIIFNAFYLIFSQSSPDNYPKRKLTSLIMKTMSITQFEISINTMEGNDSDYAIEDFEFLVAKVCHACFSSISGSLYVHGPAVRRVFELMYRAFSISKKPEIREKIQSLIDDVIILLFNRFSESAALPQVLDENSNYSIGTLTPIESFSHQVAHNLIINSKIIRALCENLSLTKDYSIDISQVDLYVLISFLCRASEMIDFNYYSMAFAVHFLISVLSIKSDFFNSSLFEILLKKHISQSLTYSFLSRQDYFIRPGSDLISTIYKSFSSGFTSSFHTILMDGLYTALSSPSTRAKSKGLKMFSNILQEKHFFPDIFVNLDCSKYYSNVFQKLTEVISENTYPKQKYRHDCTEIIKNILEMMRDFLNDMPSLIVKNSEKQTVQLDISNSNSNINLYELFLFNSYNLLMKGVSIFKNSFEKGVKYFIDNKIIEENTPECISNFLFNCRKLDRYQIALFLTESTNFEYLNFFMKNYSFQSIHYFDEALRIFLAHLTLPKDESRTDILLTAFGNLYIHTKGRQIFSSADAVASFTRMILPFQSYKQRINTLQQNGLSTIIVVDNKYSSRPSNSNSGSNSSAQEVPPLEKFVEMMKGVNDGSDLPLEFLKIIHFNISVAPIILAPLHQSKKATEAPANANTNIDNNDNSSTLNINSSTVASNMNLNDDSGTYIKKSEESASSLQMNVANNNDNDNDNEQVNSTAMSSYELPTSSFLYSLAFIDPEILIKSDKNIEWYLCKCNQVGILSKILQKNDEPFYHCKTSYVIRPMFESVWGSIHGSIVANIEASIDDEEVNEHINNLQLCIRVAAKSRAEEALVILMSSLATFAGLLNPIYRSHGIQNPSQNLNWKLTQKNVTCFKRLLNIATEEADYLAPVWHIFVEQLSLVDLYKPKEFFTNDHEITDYIENFFNSSSKFQLNSVIALINAMIKVCNKELNEKPVRRLYMLEKLVMVAQYNMKRNNEEYSQIWEIIGNSYLAYIIAVADSKNDLQLSKKVIDYIKYLTSFFLLIEEQPNENYQYSFLMTFLNVFQDQCNERSRVYLLETIFLIIKEKSISIRSGWSMIFQILTLATAEQFTQDFAFKILADLVNNQIVIENPNYVIHLISFIATYSRNANSPTSIPFFDKVCEKLSLKADAENCKSIKNSWIELFQSISRSSRTNRIEIKRAAQNSYLACLIILADKYNAITTNNSFDSEVFQPMMNSLWEFAITNTFEDMRFSELDKFLIKYDEQFIQKYITLLGDNVKHIINILILSLFKDGSESGRINKSSNTNVNADVAIQILLNLVSQNIDQSTRDFVISLLIQTIKKVPTLSLDHARSYVYLLNQFSKLFKDSQKEFIAIFTDIGNTMINSTNSDAAKRNIVCALARESLLEEMEQCDTDLLDENHKAKIINETFVIYLNSGFTQSVESLAGNEWMRVICMYLKKVNTIEDNSRFSAYFDVMAESILLMIESSSKEIRSQLGAAVERKLML